MQRTLIIGLGGTGVKIGHVIKRRISEFFSREELTSGENQLVQYLFIENDWNEIDRARAYAGETANLTDFVILPGPNANAYVERAKKRMGQTKGLSKDDADLISWFDSDTRFPSGTSAIGMAANRQLGKLALYQNFSDVLLAVQDRIETLKKAAPGQAMDGSSVAVYLISSICGGTGSSTFLDVASIVDLATERGIEKRAVLLLPSQFLRTLEGKSASDETYFRYLANSWAFMQECEYFKKYEAADKALMHRFMSRPSNLATRAEAQTSFQPFAVAYLFENQTSDEHAIQGENLYRFIGDSVFEMICGSTNTEVASSLINRDRATEKFDDHRTLAYLTLEFPRTEYERYMLARFLYECGSRHLYKPALTGQDVKDLEAAAGASCRSLQNDVLPAAIAGVTGEIELSAERAAVLRAAADKQGYVDPKSQRIKSDAELDALFDTQARLLATFVTRATSIANQQKIRYCNFQQLFSGDNEPVDRLRAAVWMAVAGVVRGAGFRGLVGDPSANEPGFLDRTSAGVLAWLASMRDELSATVESVERLRANLGNARLKVKKAAAGRLGRKGLKDVAGEVDQIGSLLSRLCEDSSRRVELDLKIAIVSAFAETSHQTPQPWLNHYSRQMRNAVEGIAQPVSVARWVDDRKPDGTSLATRYQTELRQTFQNAEKDVFRWCIPHPLHTLVSDGGWLADDPNQNALGARYSDNVVVTPAVVGEILQDETPLGDLTQSLSRIGEKPDEIGATLNWLEQRIERFFRQRYMAADRDLGKFLGSSLMDAWKKLESTPRGKDYQTAFLTATRKPPFALPMTLGGDQANNRSRFASVFADEAFVKFANKTLGVPAVQIVQHHKESLRTRLSFLQIVSKIKFADILTIGQCRTAYQSRDVEVVRPHTYRDWNRCLDGPWDDQFVVKESYAAAKISGRGYDVTLEEALLLSLMVEGLAARDKETRTALFVSDAKRLKQHHLAPLPPVSVDRKQAPPKYMVASGGHVVETGRAGSRGAAPRGLQYAVAGGRLSELAFDMERLDFGKGLQALRSLGPEFAVAVADFLRVVMSHRELLRKKLADEKKGRPAATANLMEIANRVRTMRQTGASIDSADLDFAEHVFARASAMAKRLFGQEI